MVTEKFPGKLYGKSLNCSIFDFQTLRSKISASEWSGTEIAGKKFATIWLYLASLFSILEISEGAVPCASGNFGNSNQNFRLNGRDPVTLLDTKWFNILNREKIYIFLV